MPLPKALFTVFRRHFSSTSVALATQTPKTPQTYTAIPKVRTHFKPRAIAEAQKALREYLHSTKSFPFIFAELIATNSVFSLSALIRKVQFRPRTFSETFRNLLRYEPINEFEFFLESIGVDHHNVHRYLPKNKFFFSEDGSVFRAAVSLSRFGFPWNTLGKLYEEEVSIFSQSSDELTDRLHGFSSRYGFDPLYVVGACLAFPSLLRTEIGSESCGTVETFHDLKRVFSGFDYDSCVEGNVDDWLEVCRKVRVFHDSACKKGTVGEKILEKKKLFYQCSSHDLHRKVNYFAEFGVSKVESGLLLLNCPEISGLDLETPLTSVLGLLSHFGLDEEALEGIRRKYPHVLGRNKMANLPNVTKALDLNHWCFDKIRTSNGRLLATYSISPDDDVDEEFEVALKRIERKKFRSYSISKLEFMKRIGFGENGSTIKVMKFVEGASIKLQERFDTLISLGINHSNLCSMIASTPAILCQSPDKLEQKVDFLFREMGYSKEYLYHFPRFLFFDLEKRIKPRLRFYDWLRQRGLVTEEYCKPIMLDERRDRFMARVFQIHPASLKWYLECFSARLT